MREAELLSEWIKQKHGGQLKKYAGEPYFYHLSRVAGMAEDATPLGYEIGLCHDMLEDTGTSQKELIDALRSFGYDQPAADHISAVTVALTDVYIDIPEPLTATFRNMEQLIPLHFHHINPLILN